MSVAALTDLRSLLAEVLSPAAAGDPDVIPYLPDGLIPGQLAIGWADPWLTTDQGGQCRYTGQLQVWCVASRAEPASALPEVENMVSRVLRLVSLEPWVRRIEVSQPGQFTTAGITYYGCQVRILAPTTPNGG